MLEVEKAKMATPTAELVPQGLDIAALDKMIQEAEEAEEKLAALAEAEEAEEPAQRLSVALIASRCLDAAELARKSPDEMAEAVISSKRLQLDRLRLDSMDGLDLCNGATHVQLQHNRISEIEGLDFFSSLQYLTISHNLLSSLDGLAQCGALRYLDASHNAIAQARAASLPAATLMALELMGNPCVDEAGYRPRLVEGLPELVTLDEERVSRQERGLPADDEEESEEEEGEDEEEEEGEEEGESDEVVPSRYLSSAKAAVDAELAEVDALLEQAGLPSANALLPSDASDAAEPVSIDADALYERALEELGVNAETEATRAKLRAARKRVSERREALGPMPM